MNIDELELLIEEVEKAVITLESLFASSNDENITQTVANKLMNLRARYPSEMSFDFDNLNLIDIIELLRCKCKSLNDRKGKHGQGVGYGGYGAYAYDQYGRLIRQYGSGYDEMFGEYDSMMDGDEDGMLNKGFGKGQYGDGDDFFLKMGYGMFDTDKDGLGDGSAENNNYLSIKEYATIFINKLLGEAVSKIGFFDNNFSFSDERQKRNTDKDVDEIEIELEVKEIGNHPHTKYNEELHLPTGMLEGKEIEHHAHTKSLYEEELDMTIGMFTVEIGKSIIQKTVASWVLKKKWLYCINFIIKMSDACADLYIYEVKWSIPTADYPIPQVTVLTRFTIEVSRVKLSFYHVKIYFVFEGERHRFAISDEIQHEQFLNNVMNCKTKLFKTLHFTPEQKMLYNKNYNV